MWLSKLMNWQFSEDFVSLSRRVLAGITIALLLAACGDLSEAEKRYNDGVDAQEAGELDEAVALYTEAVELDPELAKAYVNRSEAYLGLGLRDKALADATRAIELDPTDARAYLSRGLTYARLGEIGQAIADFERALPLTNDPALVAKLENLIEHPRGGPLKIGVLVAFTGDLSDFGPTQENAARLAAKEINAAGGVLGQDIEIVTGDTGTDRSQGVTDATRLVEVEEVNVILGALASGITLPIAESVTGPGAVLQISPASTSPGLTEATDNDFLFRTTISDAAQGVVLAQLATELELTSVCNMYINNAYGEGVSDSFTENFEAAGGTITAAVPHEFEQATYASELDTCTAGGPEALAAIAFPETAEVFLSEAVEAGDVGTFLFVDGTKSTLMLDELGWELFDGEMGTAPSFLETAAGVAFDAAYLAEYRETPPLPFMREMYDAVYLVALAAQKAGSTDSTAIRDALRDVTNPPGEAVNRGSDGFARALELLEAGKEINYEGAAGPIDFDENGDTPIGVIEIWRVDAARRDLITERVFQINLGTGAVTELAH